METKKITRFGLLVALAFIFSYLETLIPLPLPTGVKPGTANIVVLCALYLFGWKEALAISFVRIVLSGVAFGVSTVPYSMAGAFLSLSCMLLLKKSGKFGMTGVSVAGSVCHNLGQTLVAMLLLGKNQAFYFPILFLTGIFTGILVGILSALVLQKINHYKFK